MVLTSIHNQCSEISENIKLYGQVFVMSVGDLIISVVIKV